MNVTNPHTAGFAWISVVVLEPFQELCSQTKHLAAEPQAAYRHSPQRYVAYRVVLLDVYLCLGLMGLKCCPARLGRNDNVEHAPAL